MWLLYTVVCHTRNFNTSSVYKTDCFTNLLMKNFQFKNGSSTTPYPEDSFHPVNPQTTVEYSWATHPG